MFSQSDLLTYLLTPWCRVLLEKLTGLQLVKKFPAFHGTRRFTTTLTTVRQLSLSWASPIQSMYPHHTSWRSILIVSTQPCLGLHSGSFPPVSPPRPSTPPSPHPYVPHAQPISFFLILSPTKYWVSSTNLSLLNMQCSGSLSPWHGVSEGCARDMCRWYFPNNLHIYLRTNSDLCHLQHKLIGFYA